MLIVAWIKGTNDHNNHENLRIKTNKTTMEQNEEKHLSPTHARNVEKKALEKKRNRRNCADEP